MENKNLLSVAVIVVNWENWRDTVECLESVFNIDYENYIVILVDNFSQDDSVEKIIEWAEIKKQNKELMYVVYDRKIAEEGGDILLNENLLQRFTGRKMVFIKNEKNLYYAGGNNVGIKYAQKAGIKNILILNNDIIVEKDIIKKFILASMKFERAILGSVIYSYDFKEKIEFSGAKWSHLKGEFVISKDKILDFKETLYVSGACIFFPVKLTEEIGFFDEKFFFYDEADLCFRARKSGYKILVIPDIKVFHKGSSTFKKKNIPVEYFATKSSFLFSEKHFCPILKCCFFLIFLFKLFRKIFYYAGITRSVLLRRKKLEEKTIFRRERLKGMILGFKDYILRRFEYNPYLK